MKNGNTIQKNRSLNTKQPLSQSMKADRREPNKKIEKKKENDKIFFSQFINWYNFNSLSTSELKLQPKLRQLNLILIRSQHKTHPFIKANPRYSLPNIIFVIVHERFWNNRKFWQSKTWTQNVQCNDIIWRIRFPKFNNVLATNGQRFICSHNDIEEWNYYDCYNNGIHAKHNCIVHINIIVVNNGTHSNYTLCDNIAVGNHRKCIGYINIDTKSSNANHNKCVPVEFGHFGYPIRCIMYANHIDWNVTSWFRFWWNDV